MTTHREAFIRTQRYFRISGISLHELTGVSRNHISEFINNKRDMRTASLDKLVKAMEKLEPGALQFYTDELRGERSRRTFNPMAFVEAMDDEDVSKLMFAIAAKMGNKSDIQLKNKQLTATY